MSLQSLTTFQWPWQYEFPPFFTLQTNLDTRSKQLEGWCDLVLAYYRHIKGFTMDVNEAQTSPLFNNAKINRIHIIIVFLTIKMYNDLFDYIVIIYQQEDHTLYC